MLASSIYDMNAGDKLTSSEQGGDSFRPTGMKETVMKVPDGQLWGQPGTASKGKWDRGGVFRHPGTSPSPTFAVLALTGSQRLIFSVIALVATVVLIVWPMVRPKHYTKRELDDVTAKMRLKREIEQHGLPD